ncbi:hypothetical protein BGS_1142 [Beggiatoa sp. SS]|nr:hypothetical protein BGS_1142 [Beggiatoa sp. SS]
MRRLNCESYDFCDSGDKIEKFYCFCMFVPREEGMGISNSMMTVPLTI